MNKFAVSLLLEIFIDNIFAMFSGHGFRVAVALIVW